MTEKQIHITMGIIVGILLLVLMVAVSLVEVGEDDYVVLKRLDGKIEVLDEEGVYIRPLSKRLILPKKLLYKYYEQNKAETE